MMCDLEQSSHSYIGQLGKWANVGYAKEVWCLELWTKDTTVPQMQSVSNS